MSTDKQKHCLVCITGPTCSGKTTLQKHIENAGLLGITSFTTRNKRDGELEGKDYYFLTSKEVEKLIEEDMVVEYIKLHDTGHIYGILKTELQYKLSKGNCVVVAEPNGHAQLETFGKEHGVPLISVYVTNSPETLIGRFLKRFREDKNALILDYAKRCVNILEHEMGWIYHGSYTHMFTSYDSSNEKDVEKIILDSVKLKK